MIIVAGTLNFPPEVVDEMLAECKPLIEGALQEDGCYHYEWCPNPMVSGQVLVFESWRDEASLQNHFDHKWYKDMGAKLQSYGMLDADILKYRVDRYEPVYDEAGVPRADFFSAAGEQ